MKSDTYYKSERKTKITINCKDGSTRVITSEGVYTQSMAEKLAYDLETDNYKNCTILVQ